MKEELEKYENVTVYLTHEQDVDMSIKDRVLFAKEKSNKDAPWRRSTVAFSGSGRGLLA